MEVPVKEAAEAFARSYAAAFGPDDNNSRSIAQIADDVASFYRPGMTFFDKDGPKVFKDCWEAAATLADEIRKGDERGIGHDLRLVSCRVETASEQSALCWIGWALKPTASGLDPVEFTNVYGYRHANEKARLGWEFVIRDQEMMMYKKLDEKIGGHPDRL